MNPQRFALIGIIAGLLAASTSLFAQNPSSSPSPKETPFQLPDMSKLYSQMFGESLRPERAVQAAHFQKLYYDALIKEGFTKDDALKIIIGTPSLVGKP
jgi:hypothetical protein